MGFTFDASVTIARPREAVWEFLADPGNVGVWQEDVMSAELSFGEPMCVGARYDYVLKAPWGRRRMAEQLIEVVAGERVVSQSLGGVLEMAATTELADANTGTRVRLHGEGAPRGRLRVLGWLPPLRWLAQRRAERRLAALKRALEAPASGAEGA